MSAGQGRYLLGNGFLGRGAFHLFGASPYAGKSTLVAQLTRALYTGGDFFGLQAVEEQRIGFIFTDRSLDENISWLEMLKLSHLPTYSVVGDPEFFKKQAKFHKERVFAPGPPLLKHALEHLPRTVKVVIADVFSNAFAGGNLHDQQKVHANLGPIASFCHSQDVTIIGTCYGGKQKGDKKERYVRLCDRINGTASFRGMSSTTFYLTHSDESDGGGYQDLEIQPRTTRPHKVKLIRDDDGLFRLWTDEDADRADLTNAVVEDITTTKTGHHKLILPFLPVLPETINWAEAADAFNACAKGWERRDRTTISRWLTKCSGEGLASSPEKGQWGRVPPPPTVES